MLRLHRILLAAPVLLSLACTVSDGTSASGSSSTSDGTTTTGEPPAPTTTGDTTSGTSTTDVEPTTTDPTTGPAPTTTTDPTTGPGVPGCMATGECAEGEFCHAPYVPRIDAPGEFTCQAECVSDAGSGNSEEVWCIDDESCCTDGAVCGATGYCELAPPDTTTGDTDTDTSGTDSTGSTGDTDSTGSTGDTGGGLLPVIGLEGVLVAANCQPAVPPDPISATWTVGFDNTLGVAELTAEVTSASIIFQPGNDEFVQGITVDPTTSGIVGAGETVMLEMKKTKALIDLPMDCGQCGKPIAIEVVFDVDGQDITATVESELQCVF